MSTISNDEVAIRITVDQNQANQAILEINDNLKTLATGSEKAAAGTEKTSFSFTELNQALELGSKALNLITSGYAQLAEVMDRGNDVAEVTANFEKLQQSVGSDATQALEGLRVATQGTVSDFDLMVQASKAVRAGIPTDAFIAGADSIVKVAEAAGVDAATALNQLTMALSKGGDKALISYGINVDLEQSYKDFAATLGTTADKLNETQKVAAAQGAVLDALKEKAKGAAEGAGGAGEAFQTMSVAVQNQADRAYAAIASNEDLEQAFRDISGAINDVDIQGLISDLGNLVSALVTAGRAVVTTAEFIAFLGKTANDAWRLASGKPSQDFIDTLQDQVKASEQAKKAITDFNKAIINDDVAAAKKAYTELAGAINSNSKVSKEYGDVLDKLKPKYQEIKKEQDAQIKANEKLGGGISELTDEQKKWQKELDELERTLSGETEKALEVFKGQLEDLQKSNPDKDIYELAKSLDQVAIDALKAGASIGDIKKQIEDVKKEAGEGGLLNDLFGGDVFSGDAFEGIAEGFQEAIGEGLQSGISSLIDGILEGGSLDSQIADIGGSIGATVGSAFGPVGSAIGQAVGQAYGDSLAQIGESTGDTLAGITTVLTGGLSGFFHGAVADFFDGVFGGNQDPAANARESIEKLFNEIIDGFQEAGIAMEDFTDFGRDAFDQITDSAGNVTTTIGQMFETLSEDAQIQFQGLGTALEQALQIEGLEEGQLGQLLAANFGMGANSLNDLQLLINQMGISLEEVSAQLENAFLMGDITAGEYLVSLNQIRDLYEQGIPGAIGDTQAALNNFKEDSLSSGAAAQDALGDLAAEFQEYNESIGDTGEKTIQDLLDYLVSTGQITTEEASQMFQAFSAAGIDSLEGLMNASAEQTAVIVNNLESLGYAFQDNVESAQELREELDAIKDKEINIRLNVTSNISDEDRELLNQTNTNIPQGQGV